SPDREGCVAVGRLVDGPHCRVLAQCSGNPDFLRYVIDVGQYVVRRLRDDQEAEPFRAIEDKVSWLVAPGDGAISRRLVEVAAEHGVNVQGAALELVQRF